MDQYPALRLADVYSVIGYYLRHQEAVDDYLRQEAEADARMRQIIETEFNLPALRERLLGSQSASQQ